MQFANPCIKRVLVNDGVRLVYLGVFHLTHTKYGLAAKFPTKIGKVGTLNVFSFNRWSPTQIFGFLQIASYIHSQSILDGVEPVVSRILVCKTPKVRIGNFHIHNDTIVYRECHWISDKSLCQIHHHSPKPTALSIIIILSSVSHIIII